MTKPVGRPKRRPLWQSFLDQNIDTEPVKNYTGRRGWKGKKTGLSIGKWLEIVFEWNELRAMERSLDPSKRPLTDEQIRENLKLEFNPEGRKVKHGKKMVQPAKAIISGIHPISYQRKMYNEGRIYRHQGKPLLMSHKYFEDGNIVKIGTRRRANYPTFKEVQTYCLEYKIADPRFFSTEDLERMHQTLMARGEASEWRFPTLQEMRELFEIVPVDPYRSVLTYDLFKDQKKVRQELSSQSLKEKTSIPRKTQEDLERRRQETKKLIRAIDIDKNGIFRSR